jgi:hypothetical protein
MESPLKAIDLHDTDLIKNLAIGRTGTASVYDESIWGQSTGGLVVSFGPEFNSNALIIQLLEEIKELSAEVKSLKEDLLNRPLISSIMLNDIGDNSIDILKPIPIIIEESNDECLARWPETNAFGIGTSIIEAISNLKANIAELYFDITSRKVDSLGKIAIKTLSTFEVYIGKKR